jgi:hypothetical protein
MCLKFEMRTISSIQWVVPPLSPRLTAIELHSRMARPKIFMKWSIFLAKMTSLDTIGHSPHPRASMHFPDSSICHTGSKVTLQRSHCSLTNSRVSQISQYRISAIPDSAAPPDLELKLQAHFPVILIQKASGLPCEVPPPSP